MWRTHLAGGVAVVTARCSFETDGTKTAADTVL